MLNCNEEFKEDVMKTYAFINNKGGVGKSSSVQAIAYNMAAKFGKTRR